MSDLEEKREAVLRLMRYGLDALMWGPPAERHGAAERALAEYLGQLGLVDRPTVRSS